MGTSIKPQTTMLAPGEFPGDGGEPMDGEQESRYDERRRAQGSPESVRERAGRVGGLVEGQETAVP